MGLTLGLTLGLALELTLGRVIDHLSASSASKISQPKDHDMSAPQQNLGLVGARF